MNFLFNLMMLVTIVTVYVFWVRPILKKTPSFANFFAQEGNVVAAVRAKFDGIKQRLLHAFVGMAGIVVVVHDRLAPEITGIDVTPITTTLSHYVPDWGWPLVAIGFVSLMDWFRSLADKGMQEKIDAIAPQPPAPPSV